MSETYLNFGAKIFLCNFKYFLLKTSNETFLVVFHLNQLLEAFLIRFPYVFFSKLDVSHETDTLGMGNPIATQTRTCFQPKYTLKSFLSYKKL